MKVSDVIAPEMLAIPPLLVIAAGILEGTNVKMSKEDRTKWANMIFALQDDLLALYDTPVEELQPRRVMQ